MLLKFKDLWKKIIIIIMVVLISTSTFAKPTKTDAFALELWMLGVMATMLVGGGIVFTQEPTQQLLTDIYYDLSEEVQQGIANAQSLGTAFFMVGINEYRKFLDDIYTLFGLSTLSAGAAIAYGDLAPLLEFTLSNPFTTSRNHTYITSSYNVGQYTWTMRDSYTIPARTSTVLESLSLLTINQFGATANLTSAFNLTRETNGTIHTYYETNIRQYFTYQPPEMFPNISTLPAGTVYLTLTSECLTGCDPLNLSIYPDGRHHVVVRDNQGYFNLNRMMALGIATTSIMQMDLAIPLPDVWDNLDENEKDEALKDGFANHNGKLILGGAAAAIGSAIGTLTPPLVRDVPKDGSWLEDLTDEDINNIGLAGVIAAFAQLLNTLVKKVTDTFDKPSPSPGNIDLLKTTIMMKVPCMTEFTGAFEQIMELQGETPVHTFTLFGKQYSFEYYKLFEGFIHVSSYIKQFFNFILWFLFLRGGIRRITSTLSGGTTEGNDQ